MPELYGRCLTRREIVARVGDISQIARVKLHRLAEGFEDGVLAADVITGTGFQFTVLPSRGLDISSASYCGRSLAWRSAQGDRHPAFYEPEGLGWLRSFPGGLLTTCGLTWMGAPDTDEGVALGLHGRHSNAPASEVRTSGSWDGDNYILTVEGTVRESVVFGENVVLRRRITATMGESRLFLEDSVTNEGFAVTPHMILYHVNFGYPIVDDGASIVVPALTTEPRDEEALQGVERCLLVEQPVAGYKEKVYFHTVKPDASGEASVGVLNPQLDGGLMAYVRYRPEELPHLVEWKMMGAGTYVVGLEPANARVMGRSAERAAGRLQYLQPNETRRYRLEIGVKPLRDRG
jgi:hypothetical protein